MADCPHCGAPSPMGPYCSSCGRSVAGVYAPTSPAVTPIRAPAQATPGERPLGVTLVAVGYVLLAVAAVFFGFLVFVSGTIASAFITPWWSGWSTFGGAIQAVLTVVALGAFLFAALCAAVAYGLFNAQSWAWGVALVIAGLSALSSLFSLAQFEVDALLGVLVWGGVVYYFLRPEVRAHFSRT